MFSEQKIQHRRVLSHARCPFSLDTLARPSEAPLYWVRPDLVGENRADRVGVSLCSVPLVDYGVIEWTKNEFYCLSRLIGSIDHFIKEGMFVV